MAKEESADDLRPITWKPLGHLSGKAPFDRLDFGDAAQRAEMEGVVDPVPEEPVEMVDAPIQIRPPFTRGDKKRNQRPLPT